MDAHGEVFFTGLFLLERPAGFSALPRFNISRRMLAGIILASVCVQKTNIDHIRSNKNVMWVQDEAFNQGTA